jgi:p-hydroxybenzoate 3-monooxygenase
VTRLRTQVVVVGAGPAGLTLSELLFQAGIEAIVLENRTREHVESRIRAGVLEQGTVAALERAGVAERLHREGLVHGGIHLQFGGERHHVSFTELLSGAGIVVYGQTEVVKDLIAARLEGGRSLLFGTSSLAVHELDGRKPYVTFEHDGEEHRVDCDVIAGCDGFHGVCRPAIEACLRSYAREYPYAWLGILADAPPSSEELVYAHHQRGFALLSLRSETLSRLYLQCRPDEQLAEWPDDRIWEELALRTSLEGLSLNEGPVLEKGITGMRSFVAEPMQRGRLFLAGDAAHIVPPTGAKGLNLAVHDVLLLADAVIDWYATNSTDRLDGYSAACLQRIWRAEHFSWWMTSMLHRAPDGDDFDERLQLSQLRYVTTSRAAATSLAENYVGLDRL